MTKLGLFLSQRSVNKSEAARKAGLSKARMNELTLNERSHLRAEELYLIALAIGVDPGNFYWSMFVQTSTLQSSCRLQLMKKRLTKQLRPRKSANKA